MAEERKMQLGVEVNAASAQPGFDEIRAGAKEMAADVSSAGDAASKGMDRATKGMVASIQRATASMQAGGKGAADYYRVLADQRGVNIDVLNPYLAQLDDATKKQKAMALSAGVSAAQTIQAMRMVPMQMTDIFTQLAGGQNPLLIMVQQGGQLKDSFGGMGPMFGALTGMITPFVAVTTSAAVVVGALGYAYYQGAQEAKAFSSALIMTGNVAGVTVGQLQTMAGVVAETSGATKGAAAAVLAQLAGTGDIYSANMSRLADATLKNSRATGAAVGDMVKQFAELGHAPLEASLKLNEKMHYLTVEIYRQIKALEDQGRTLEAGRVAQDAYADAMVGRASQITENLGTVAAGWKHVADFAKSAWDEMLGLGRKESMQDELARLQTTTKFEAAGKTAASPYLQGYDLTSGDADKKARIAVLQESIRLENRLAASVAESAAAAQKRAAWDKEVDKFLPDRVKQEREIVKARELGKAAGISDLEINKQIAAIKEKYKKEPKKDEVQSAFMSKQLELTKSLAQSELARFNAAEGIAESAGKNVAVLQVWLAEDEKGKKLSVDKRAILMEIAALADQSAAAAAREVGYYSRMTAAGQQLIKLRRDAESIRTTGQGAKYTEEADYLNSKDAEGLRQSGSATDLAMLEAERRRKSEIDSVAKTSASNQYLYSLQEQEKSISRQIQLLAMSTLEQEKQQALWAAADEFDKSIGKYANELEFQEAKTKYLEQQMVLIDQINQKRTIERDPVAQSILALRNYADEATNVGAQIANVWGSAFKGMEDAMVKFAQTGTLSVGDMANSIIADLIRIQMRASITGPLAGMLASGIASMFGGSMGSTDSHGNFSASDYLYNANGTVKSANGNVFTNGSLTAFANGSAFSNGIATSPTVAPMALFGEAGPEAIMPLRRDSSGRLGVASAGGAAPNIQINYIDQTSEKKEVTTSKPAWNGEAWVVDVIAKKMATDSRFRQMVRG